MRVFIVAVVCLFLSGLALAQSRDDDGPMTRVPVDKSAPPPKDNRKSPPRSDELGPDESSSKQTQIDISPPSGDAKKADTDNSEVTEFHPWDPLKAMKCVEVGDFYLQAGELSRRHQSLPGSAGVEAARCRSHLQTWRGAGKIRRFHCRSGQLSGLSQNPAQRAVCRESSEGHGSLEIQGWRYFCASGPEAKLTAI